MDLVQRLLKLVEIPSVIGAERQICDYLEQRLRAHAPSYEIERIDDNLALRPRTRTARPLVGLVGHIDTVPPPADNPPRREGDRIYGLGSSDMKGGVALMWQLAEQPVARPTYDLALIFYSGEEGPFEGSGLGPLLAQLGWLAQIDLALCLEPSDNVLQLGCMGTIHATLTFRGRAAHSARPWHGENAVHKAARVLSRLAAAEPLPVTFGDLEYREVMQATLAEGGSARNVIPDRFAINLNYRFAPGRSLEQAEQVIAELVAGDAEIDFVDRSPSGPIPAGNPVLDAFRRKCPVDVAPKQAWTDVARLAAAGIDAINFGPGQSDQAHQPDEYASIPHLLAGDRLLRGFLAQ